MSEEIVNKSEIKEIICNTIDLKFENKIYRIQSYKIDPVGEEVLGFLGDYFRLSINVKFINETKYFKYFIKMLPRNDPETKKMIEDIGVFKKEMLLYQVLFAKMKNVLEKEDLDYKWHPSCYFTRPDCIVMEEIDASYKHLPDRMAYEPQHVRELLKTIARMHAASLELEIIQLKGERIDEKFSDLNLTKESIGNEDNTWFRTGLDLMYFICSKYKNYLKTKFDLPSKPQFMDLLNKVLAFQKDQPQFQNVLCHRDLWNKNILLRFDPDSKDFKSPQHCMIVDFQICRYQPPAVDVILAIHFTARRSLREEKTENWCRFYLEYLSGILKETFKFPKSDLEKLNFLNYSEFKNIVKYYKLFTLVMNCIYVPMVYLESGIISKMQIEDPHKYYELCNVNRNEFTAKYMEKDQYYREYVLEVFDELLEFMMKM